MKEETILKQLRGIRKELVNLSKLMQLLIWSVFGEPDDEEPEDKDPDDKIPNPIPDLPELINKTPLERKPFTRYIG